MKKILILLVLISCLSIQGFSQPTALITVENPRIDGNQFLFDVYFERTNDDALWYGTGWPYPNTPGIAAGSWWFKADVTALSNPTISNINPTYFGTYNFIPAMNITIGSIAVTQSPTGAPPSLPLNVMFHAFTVSCTIGTPTSTSLLNNDVINTGLMAFGGISGIPFSVTESFLTSGCDIALNHKCWDGSSNGDWDNANNWSPSGIPLSTDDVIYPNNPSNELASMNSSIAVTVNDLRINHFAEMHVLENRSLTVDGDVSLKGGTNLVLDASTSPVGVVPNDFIYSSGFIPKGSVDYSAYIIEDGHIDVHRTLHYEPTAATYYMHQVAAPVRGIMLVDWDMEILSTYAFEWRTATQEWFNIYATWRSTPAGYGFRVSLYGQSTASTRDLVFTDNLVLVDTVITFDAIQSGENALIGNPYVAPVDWELAIADQTNVSNTVYIWNPKTTNYETYVAGSGGALSARYIQLGQSFFIDATGNVSSFTFDLDHRAPNIQPYLKQNGFPYLLNLFTEGGNGSSETVYIRFKEGEDVTTDYDRNHDGEHKVSEQVNFATELYTVTTDGFDLAVDARPMLVGDDVSVPLHFKPVQDDTYRIVADEESMESFPPSISIMLEDTFEPQQDWIDLRLEGYYEFEAEKYDPRDRFIVHFYDLEFGIEDGGVEPIQIYSDRTDAFIINESEQLIKEIQVYDVMGNLITRKATINTSRTRLFISDEVGYYIVKVITDKAVYSEKVLITK